MKVFKLRGFYGHYPVNTALVVVALSEDRAIELVNEELTEHGLPTLDSPENEGLELEELDLTQEQIDIMCNGDY